MLMLMSMGRLAAMPTTIALLLPNGLVQNHPSHHFSDFVQILMVSTILLPLLPPPLLLLPLLPLVALMTIEMMKNATAMTSEQQRWQNNWTQLRLYCYSRHQACCR
jgi:hypothetical protein